MSKQRRKRGGGPAHPARGGEPATTMARSAASSPIAFSAPSTSIDSAESPREDAVAFGAPESLTTDSGYAPDAADERQTFAPREDVAEISPYFLDHAQLEEGSAANAPASRDPVSDVAGELRAVEAEVDRIFGERARRAGVGQRPGDVRRVALQRGRPESAESARDVAALGEASKDVLSTDHYLNQLGRIGLRNRSEEVDELGLDPAYEKRLRPVLDFMCKHWFRVETRGIENVPSDGRCILVANHSGVLPLDGIVVRTTLRLEHERARDVRWLAEDFIFHLPFVGSFMNRIGAVRACQENAERLLRQERCVLVFPEGIQGVGKLYRDRYQLQRFGRGGFIKLALRTRSPIVPVSIVGAEESSPMLYRIEYLTQALGLPFLPVTPTFPALGPLGLVPAPAKWAIEFGAPLSLDEHGSEAADDALLVGRLADRVRGEIQKTLDRRVHERKSVWLGW